MICYRIAADKSHLILLVWEIIVFQFETAFEMGGKKYQMNMKWEKPKVPAEIPVIYSIGSAISSYFLHASQNQQN